MSHWWTTTQWRFLYSFFILLNWFIILTFYCKRWLERGRYLVWPAVIRWIFCKRLDFIARMDFLSLAFHSVDWRHTSYVVGNTRLVLTWSSLWRFWMNFRELLKSCWINDLISPTRICSNWFWRPVCLNRRLFNILNLSDLSITLIRWYINLSITAIVKILWRLISVYLNAVGFGFKMN